MTRELAVVGVTVVGTLVMLAVLDAAPAPTVPKQYCVTDEAARERIRGFMFASLDEALHEQFQHLFLTWMKDDRGQPERARTGVMAAIAGHKTARILATEWIPPICTQ
jgi:hypothetical protein